MVMIDKNAFDDDDDPTLNNMATTSAQLLDTSIEDVTNKKETMVSAIDSVISLMKRVEYEEKAAEQAKEEAARGHSDIMSKVFELVNMRKHVMKENDMLAKEACEQKKQLSTKMEALQLHVTLLSDKGDRSLELLDEMSRSLEMRLNSAFMKKNLAIKRKKENEAFARATLAYQEIQMEKVEEESKRLKQEAGEIFKLQEFIVDRGHLVTSLHEEISDKCRDVKRLKRELDQVVLPGVKISSSRKSSISASSRSALVSSIIPCQPQPEPADSNVLYKNGDFIDDHAQSANCRPVKSVIEFSEADMEKQQCVADIARGIKNVRIKGKLHANLMFAKCIKKVKIKGKLLSAKSIKKIKIKSKLRGNHICAKSIKKLKIKGKQRRSHVCCESIKKLKIKGKQHGNHMLAKSIKSLQTQDNRHGSQIRVKSIKKVKIKKKLNGSQLCPKSIKKVNTNDKQQGCQMCAITIKKVKIKGLQVVLKRRPAADDRD